MADRPRLHVGPSPDQDPFDEIEREEPVLDQAGVEGSPTSPVKSAMTPPSGLGGTPRTAVGANRRKVDASPKESSSRGIGW